MEKSCETCKHSEAEHFEEPCVSCPITLGLPYWEPKEKAALDTQVGGSHYQSPIQPVDFIVKNNIKWREANVIKYVFRHEKKNGVEDLKKARHYLDMLIEDYNASV